MSEQDPAIVGIEKCGCVTYVDARPHDLTEEEKADLYRYVESGGQLVNLTVGEARELLTFPCPHTPAEPVIDNKETPDE